MASIGTPYKQFRSAGPFDVVVIGSGIGGLGAAALLAKAAGRRVLVVERHYTAGGFTHTFHRPGFEWDVGVHYIGQVHRADSPAAALIDYVTEGRLHWNAMPDVYDRVIASDLRFDYVAGRQRVRDDLARTFPRETGAIDRYFKAIRSCVRRVAPYYVGKVLPPLAGRLIGPLLRAPFLRYARRTTGGVLDDLGASRELKAVLAAQWGDYGLPPGQSSFGIHAIVVDHYADGAAYPVGGASRIAASVLPIIERAGGALVVSADVDRIVVEDGRAVGVRMADGREIRAAAIVSDAGVRATFDRLLRGPAPPTAEPAFARLRQLAGTAGHLCLYVGLTFPDASPRFDPANIWVHPTLDYDANMSAFTADLNAPFPFLYISFPSEKDPTFGMRYPQHHTIEVVTMAPYDAFASWANSSWKRRGADYDELKQRLSDRLLRELYRHVPAASGAVTACELSTPLSTRHFAGAPRGESYGLAHSPARFESRDVGPRTPIQRLFLTGQDVSMCGVMGALSGAATTASAMLGRNIFGTIARAARAKSAG